MVLLIDALDQFEPTPRGRYLTWLPAAWPDNARLIATAIPGSQSQALQERRGVRLIRLPLLDRDEAQAIAAAVCGRYHRRLNPDVLEELLRKHRGDGQSSAGIPLWLELALEELQLLDADDFQRAQRQYEGSDDQRLRLMMRDVAAGLPGDVEPLYGEMLARCETLYGRGWARGFAALIAVSRHGWREADLKELLPRAARLMAPGEPAEAWNDLKFAALRRAFRAHLVQRGAQAQWDFFHAQMRLAVQRKWLQDAGLEPQLHVLIADHLQTLFDGDPLRHAELMFHQIGTEDRLRAGRYYAGLARGGDELLGATRALADHIAAGLAEAGNPRLAWILSLLDEAGLETDQRAELCSRYDSELLNVLEYDTPLASRLGVVDRTCAVLKRLCGEDAGNTVWQHELSVSESNIGDLLIAQRDLTGALASYLASVEIRAAGGGRARQRRPATRPRGQPRQDRRCARPAGDALAGLACHRASLEIRARLAAADPGNAGWQRDLSLSRLRIGDLLRAVGDLTGALASYRASLEICAAGGGRPRQRRLATRPVSQPRSDRRCTQCAEGPDRGASLLPRDSWDLRAAGGGRPRQRWLATRPRGQPAKDR